MSDGNSACSSDDEEIDLEAKRAQSTKERDDFLAQIMGDSGLSEAIELMNEQTDAMEQQEAARKRLRAQQRSSGNRDSAFRFFGQIPTGERRTSQRLLHKQPHFTYEDLPDETGTSFRRSRPRSSSYDLEGLEDVVFEVRRRSSHRGGGGGSGRPSSPIAVEDVTEDMLRRVVTSGMKQRSKLSNLGSSCHQCRQKTLDMKTSCRSGKCVGKRGQFCGICVITRYGEDPIEALRDPDWSCYVCRGMCNCSFCRTKDGKRPTGILYPMAVKYGFKSVADYLRSLRGYGDYALDDDPDAVVGFDGDTAITRDGRTIDLNVLGDCPPAKETPKRRRSVQVPPVDRSPPLTKKQKVDRSPPLTKKQKVDRSPPLKKKPKKAAWLIKLTTKKKTAMKKPTSEDMLGFDDDFASMGDGKVVELKPDWAFDDPKTLKGFSGDDAVFSDGTSEPFKKWIRGADD